MQIVIDIAEKDYNDITLTGENTINLGVLLALREAVRNGIPLPEHHGRLIDADRLTRAEVLHIWYHLPNGDIACPKIDIDHAPTIIEADRGE